MAPAAVVAGPWTQRRRRTAELRRRHSFARELLDFYGVLLGVQERAYDEALSVRPSPGELVAFVAETAVPAVIDASLVAGPARLGEALARRLDAGDARDVIAAWIQGEDQGVVDRFLARASAGPALEALGPEAGASCIGVRDGRHCPSCGGPPQLSYFAVPAEDLATGGRFLVCARCSADWGYTRMTCPACGEDSSARLPIFNEEGTASGERGSVVRGLQGRLDALGGGEQKALLPHVRIEACDSCGQYLLGIDLAADPAAIPLVDELAAVPLDLYAREQGYSKITPNLLGF
jgi:rRNA maturation protein Nop10